MCTSVVHKGFFLPVRVLSRLFRRLFLEALERAFWRGELAFHGLLQELAAPDRFAEVVKRARTREWVMYAQPPFGGLSQVHLLNQRGLSWLSRREKDFRQKLSEHVYHGYTLCAR